MRTPNTPCETLPSYTQPRRRRRILHSSRVPPARSPGHPSSILTMVSTRSSSSRADSVGPDSASPPSATATTPTKSTRSRRTPAAAASSSSSTTIARRSDTTSAKAAAAGRWAHTPTSFTLLWMAVSLPLVVWDTVYVLGRPHTMEGGWLHWPLWVPYKLYGEVDHVYGWKAVHARNGFTAAQGFLNAIETAMYVAYVAAWWAARRRNAEGRLEGRDGALAVLVGFSAAVMTLSKTVLYWMNEYYSGFDNIGHNALAQLIPLWIIPNGAWLVGSTYMIWSMGASIVDGLEAASGHAKAG
ncbi:C6 transcription factor [Purpureocillium lavendulum]|uniref:C6 transcription factor n=1 Tax=Purpureocillium lavendulum TaxID=1247861 RepID=A0AB34G776_9HYPO|nr:C6 transcription factor [Purpureocillium lavendulum]